MLSQFSTNLIHISYRQNLEDGDHISLPSGFQHADDLDEGVLDRKLEAGVILDVLDGLDPAGVILYQVGVAEHALADLPDLAHQGHHAHLLATQHQRLVTLKFHFEGYVRYTYRHPEICR